MTTTPAMPELPEPRTLSRGDEDGHIQLGYTADQMRAYALATLQAQPAAESPCACWPGRMCSRSAQCARDVQPAEVSDEVIEEIARGKSNHIDFARAILALRPQADHPDTARCIKARNDLNAALHGEGALIDDLEHAVANACAKLLRPQAVPMPEPVQRLSRYAGQTMRTARNPNITAREAIEIGDYLAAIGITAQGAQGGEG